MKVKIVTFIYFLIFIIDGLSILFEWTSIDKFTRPLLMPILIYYIIESTQGKIYKNHLIFVTSIIFMWIGDLISVSLSNDYFALAILAYTLGFSILTMIFKSRLNGMKFVIVLRNNLLIWLILSSIFAFGISYLIYLDLSIIKFITCGVLLLSAIVFNVLIQTKVNWNHTEHTLRNGGWLLLLSALLMIWINTSSTGWDNLLLLGYFFAYGNSQFLITEGINERISK